MEGSVPPCQGLQSALVEEKWGVESAQVWESEYEDVGRGRMQGTPWGRGSIDPRQELAAKQQGSPQLGGSLQCDVSPTVVFRALSSIYLRGYKDNFEHF